MFSSRCELFEDNPAYAKAFFPLTECSSSASENIAKSRLSELHIVSFRDRIDEYLLQHIALQWRDSFLGSCGGGASFPKWMRPDLVRIGALVGNQGAEVIRAVTAKGVSQENKSEGDALTSQNGLLEKISLWRKYFPSNAMEALARSESLKSLSLDVACLDRSDKAMRYQSAMEIVAVLAAATGSDPSNVAFAHNVRRFLFTEIYGQDSNLWTLTDFKQQMSSIPELLKLSTTPFMTQIMIQVLPVLKRRTHTIEDMRNSVMLHFGDYVAEIVWSELPHVVHDLKKLVGDMDGIEVSARSVGKDEADIPVEMKKNVLEDEERRCRVQDQFLELSQRVYDRCKLSERQDVRDYAVDTSPDALIDTLRFVLRRPKTRRYGIYALFLDLYYDREVAKCLVNSSFNCAMSPSELLLEAKEYSRHLALTLTKTQSTKLARPRTSQFFEPKK